MANIRHFLFIFALHLFTISIFSQITIKELPPYNLAEVDSLFFDINQTRSIIDLKNDWQVYTPSSPDKKVKVSVPSTFAGSESLVYERGFFISKDQAANKNLSVRFLGITYTADVLLNDLVIYKHPGGIQPFSIILPPDILKSDSQNKLSVKVQYELDDKNTIPIEQRFLYPSTRGGIIGDVYLYETNKLFISKLKIEKSLSQNLSSATIKILASVQNNLQTGNDLAHEEKNYKLKFTLTGSTNSQTFVADVNGIKVNESREVNTDLTLATIDLWSPSDPRVYKLDVELSLNDSVIDKSVKTFSLFDLSPEENKLHLNNQDFQIKGTTYFYFESETGGLASFEKLKKDLELIKATGFNTIRFAKVLPPTYALHLCESLGLTALVEVPINSIPAQILLDDDFSNRVTNHLNLMIDQYSDYSSVIGFGLGGGFLGSNEDEINFLRAQAQLLDEKTDKLVYASFIILPKSKIASLDLAGIELFGETELPKPELITDHDFSVFISEVTYPSFIGNSNGYLNKNSYEAAAKYFSDIIDFSFENKINGFILNSFYDFSGDYKSLYAGYNEQNIYKLGLLANPESTDRISYNVVKSKLTNGEKITIPIGTEKDDSPILFVIIGLVLSIFMALLINSKRKFREDAGRALIRPYNFYADIRDHRLLSGFQTILLMFILAGSFALLIINLLHFLRTNIHLEKLLLSFGSPSLIDMVIYLAWFPFEGFFILFFISIAVFILFSLVIKMFSFSLKTKVYFSSIYYTVIWAFLPLSLLLPLELVLYRVLIANVINPYVYIFITLFLLWLGQRLLKGIHVIFDVRSSTVHFYSIILIIVVIGGILLYFQLTNSSLYHIIRAVSEYKFL
ncbi:MAG: glycoside hydrolase family 2 TIM barrel-domain containing protein [Melioribacteraceae bacterium]|nr:MAG: glycoside hydrolase family 2 TIM barrel-domain containing protein [Melioribacteraceae bacterium]